MRACHFLINDLNSSVVKEGRQWCGDSTIAGVAMVGGDQSRDSAGSRICRGSMRRWGRQWWVLNGCVGAGKRMVEWFNGGVDGGAERQMQMNEAKKKGEGINQQFTMRRTGNVTYLYEESGAVPPRRAPQRRQGEDKHDGLRQHDDESDREWLNTSRASWQ
ncbi:hypothetical protein PIB30_065187 [Stylosanthes scabra]|uniref:Uncharacterized protein n=1 Tax=Stylosanthes scabra TaxID=79078 RepID=A0ABU6XJT6_9FABA|nr:hypothetical protein [Stylosanthes scabra]